MKKLHGTVAFTLMLFSAIMVFIILRIPSLFEPHWYGDEGVYAAVAHFVELGRKLYVEVWDNKPPGIYLIYMLGNNANRLAVVRFASIVAGVVTLFGLAAIARRMKFSLTGYCTVLVTAVFFLGTPILEGNIANAENFFLPFTVWGLYYALSKRGTDQVAAGALFGAGFWIKFHPIFDAAAVGLSYILFYRRRPWFLVVGFGLAGLAMLGYFAIHGNVVEAVQTIFLGNVDYTSEFSDGLLAQRLKVPLLLVGLGGVWLMHRRKMIESDLAFLLALLVVEYFAVLFSGRRYLHYVQQAVPGIALVIGYIVNALRKQKDVARYVWLTTGFIVVSVGAFKLFATGGGYLLDTNPVTYYSRFSKYMVNHEAYFLSDVDMRIAQMQTTLAEKYPRKKVHIYSDNPWLLDMTGNTSPVSFIAVYHQDLKEGGREQYVREVDAYKPDVVVKEKRVYRAEPMEEYLREKYVWDAEDEDHYYLLLR